MRKSKVKNNPIDSITTNLEGVMLLLGVGRDKARKIGVESGALIKIGKRSLYKVDVIRAYINSL